MSTRRWQRIDELTREAAALPVEQRDAWLADACGADVELRREVESLLVYCDRPLGFLDEPALSDDVRLSPGALLELPDRDQLIGETIGHYRIERQIGSGGMATVYEASRWDGDFEHRIAIKVLHAWIEPDELLRRFHVERQSLAHLNHTNIARLLDAGVTGSNQPYLMMEYIDGVPIDDSCDEHRLTITQRLQLFQQVCHAVHFAHQNLVVHRDLKPGNILVTREGVPKLLDFGIAKILDDDDGAPDNRTRTATHHRMLTPDYASPEQVSGEPVTTETDVYSLGVVLYALLAGRPPYRLTSRRLEEIERAITHSAPPRPSTALLRGEGRGELDAELIAARRGTTADRLARRLRGDLDNIVLMALRKEPHRRYSSAEALADDLQRHLEGRPVRARKDTLRYRTVKFVRRNRLAVGAAAAVVAALLIGTVATAWQARVAADERDAARQARKAAEHEAAHAQIEAESAGEVASFLAEAFLAAAPVESDGSSERARALLDRQIVRVHRQYEGQPHLQANLLHALGEVHLRLGLDDRAEALLLEAADIRRANFGADSLEMALSLEGLGTLHFERGAYQQAEEHFRETLRLHRELPEGVHTDVALAANNLAVVCRALGRIDEAEALHREALALRRDDGRTLLVAESLNNLAGIFISRADHAGAEPLLREALAIRRELLSEEHPLVAQTMNNLAMVLVRSGRVEEAGALSRDAIDLYRRLPGIDPQELARALGNLAAIMQVGGGDHRDIRELLSESLTLLRARLGDDHPHVATVLSRLAQLNASAGDAATAADHWAEVLRIRRATLPDPHPQIAAALAGRGLTALALGRYEEAEPLLRRSLEMNRQTLPEDHPSVAGAMVNLGGCLIELGRLAEAEELLEGARALLEPREASAPREVKALREQLAKLRRK